MKTMFAIAWDNGEEYDLHEDGIWAVCSSKERAEEIAKQLTEDIRNAANEIRQLQLEDRYDDAERVEELWYDKLRFMYLDNVRFYVYELDYIE